VQLKGQNGRLVIVAELARLLPRHWDGQRLLRFLTGLALLALAFAAPIFAAPVSAAAAPVSAAVAPVPAAVPASAALPVAAPASGSAASSTATPAGQEVVAATPDAQVATRGDRVERVVDTAAPAALVGAAPVAVRQLRLRPGSDSVPPAAGLRAHGSRGPPRR
jgi:hypothetical protein